MCLWSKDIKPKKLKEDLTVYKIFRLDYSMGFVTPYQNYSLGEIFIGKEFTTKQFNNNPFSHDCGDLGYAILYGFHFYAKKEDAIKQIAEWEKYRQINNKEFNDRYGPLFISECIIKKGSEYYEGLNDFGNVTICAGSFTLSNYKEFKLETENETL